MELSRIGEGSFGCSLLKNYKTGLGGGDAETVLEQPGQDGFTGVRGFYEPRVGYLFEYGH